MPKKNDNDFDKTDVTLEHEWNKEAPKEELENKPFKKPENVIKYREVVYVGIANEAGRFGKVTGRQYAFKKDQFGMPIATLVDEKDYSALVTEKGRGCARSNPQALFISKVDWDLEIQQAKAVNR